MIASSQLNVNKNVSIQALLYEQNEVQSQAFKRANGYSSLHVKLYLDLRLRMAETEESDRVRL